MKWQGRRIILGVTGCVAIYKAVGLASRLTQAGAEVEVVMTPAAKRFLTPLQFSAVTRRPTHHRLWREVTHQPGHIALAEWAELLVVAPVTANTMAKITYGLADNLLTSVILAASHKPLLLAPAMNTGMWDAAATQDNLAQLVRRGVATVGPGEGHLACGSTGKGRLAETEEIIAALERMVLA
ncbi:MAG: hypothetical protein LBU79_01315 [Planctomycetota bacterium]|jgi:phosphopantothenoylcysteine decarboxylase/phosphopantothenate--cysteine ligase|nr:hypothetical protein [Planctomycetota bacterium]